MRDGRGPARRAAPSWRAVALVLCLAVSTILAGRAEAAEPIPGLETLATRWAEVSHRVAPAGREQAFEALLGEADTLTAAWPGRAEPLAWKGIILASAARSGSALPALDRAKRARDVLLQALRLDERAVNGAIYTALGQLYYRVPRWPIGFGDQDRALGYLRKALAIDPQSLDANYLLADYLAAHGADHEALIHARKALAAAPRPGLEAADADRRAETRALLDGIERRLAAAEPNARQSYFQDSDIARTLR